MVKKVVFGFGGVCLYRNVENEVELSKPIGASMKGEITIKYLPMGWFALRRTFVVWPGLRKMVSVSKGLV